MPKCTEWNILKNEEEKVWFRKLKDSLFNLRDFHSVLRVFWLSAHLFALVSYHETQILNCLVQVTLQWGLLVHQRNSEKRTRFRLSFPSFCKGLS